MNSEELATKICKLLSDHKAGDVCLINVKEKTALADYFIIASGNSVTHTKALINHVTEMTEKEEVFAKRKEGVREGRWAVLDFGDVILHVFNDQTRLFYHLEALWDDGTNVKKF